MPKPKFKEMDVVEQINLGDYPAFIVEVQRGLVNRYKLSHIDGVEYSNIPEYMLRPARPIHESKWANQQERETL